MYEFLDRMISLAFPRVKDFRGVNPNGFDNDGNYNFGFTEQTVFPEVDGADRDVPAGHEHHDGDDRQASADEGRELLKQFGFPFRDGREGRSKPRRMSSEMQDQIDRLALKDKTWPPKPG